MKALWGFLFSLAVLDQASAFTLTEEFDSRQYLDSQLTTLVWNSSLGLIHPTLIVTGASDASAGALPDANFAVGSGIHGPFVLSTYANFSVGRDVSGQIIRLDTDSYTSLEVTEFHLESGWTLQPVGSNPLVIRSLSDIIVEGTISCSGSDGEAIAADIATTASGGDGRCGGKNGGNGGSNTTGASNGVNSGISVTGGHAGTASGAGGADGGGGGGGFGTSAPADPGVRPSGGGDSAAGASLDEPTFSTLAGGSGGGGGEAYTPAGAGQSRGGGGGGGGGLIQLFAVRDVQVTATGQVKADGGHGGSGAAGLLGGGGGGGGAGSIMIWAGGDITAAIAGSIGAEGGQGGTSSGGDGGVGSIGRTWLADKDGTAGTEVPVSTLAGRGNTGYKLATQSAVSKSYDLGNTVPKINSVADISSLPSGGLITVEVAGSNDDFASDNTGWVNVESLSQFQAKRYFRFRVTLTNADLTNPSLTQSISIDYDKGERDQFDFQAACGRMGNDDSTGLFNVLIMALLLLAMRVGASAYYRAGQRSRV